MELSLKIYNNTVLATHFKAGRKSGMKMLGGLEHLAREIKLGPIRPLPLLHKPFRHFNFEVLNCTLTLKILNSFKI